MEGLKERFAGDTLSCACNVEGRSNGFEKTGTT